MRSEQYWRFHRVLLSSITLLDVKQVVVILSALLPGNDDYVLGGYLVPIRIGVFRDDACQLELASLSGRSVKSFTNTTYRPCIFQSMRTLPHRRHRLVRSGMRLADHRSFPRYRPMKSYQHPLRLCLGFCSVQIKSIYRRLQGVSTRPLLTTAIR